MSKLDNVLEEIKAKHRDAFVNIDIGGTIRGFQLESPQMNYLFGGKFPKGRVIELFGPESSGKSSVATWIAMQNQKYNVDRPIVLYIDYERTFDKDHAIELGLDISEDKFQLIQPLTGEEGFEICKEFTESLPVGLIIWDSIGATPSASQMEDAFKATFGGTANVLSSGLKMLNPYLSKYDTSLIFINQERAMIGGFSPVPGQTSTPGGFARKFYATSRNRITKIENIKDHDNTVGIRIKIRNVKSKCGVPYREAIIDLYFAQGINSDGEYMKFFLDLLCTKSGQFYCNSDWLMEDPKTKEAVPMRIRGRDNTERFLTEYFEMFPDKYAEAKQKVNDMICGKTSMDKNLTIDNEDILEKATEEEIAYANGSGMIKKEEE